MPRLIQQLIAVLTLGAAAAAQAQTTIPLVAGEWFAFDVDALTAQSGGNEWIDLSTGAPLSFSFTLASDGIVRVVDAGFAGDTFNFRLTFGPDTLYPGYTSIGHSRDVPLGDVATSVNVGTDFDAAWSNDAFTRTNFILGAGSYTLTGSLRNSVTFDGEPLNATVGAVMLAPVPEPTTYALLLAGLGFVAVAARRRRA